MAAQITRCVVAGETVRAEREKKMTDLYDVGSKFRSAGLPALPRYGCGFMIGGLT